jgi:restriction system protein
MKNYYRVMLGSKSVHAKECHAGNFIGAGFGIDQDLTAYLPERWQDFNAQFRPVWLAKNPGKSKVSAGLACGALHTICKGIFEGDIVLCPDGEGAYMVGEVVGPYAYLAGHALPHRRPVKWLPGRIRRDDMSVTLQNSAGSWLTVIDINTYAPEIEGLISGHGVPAIFSNDATVEDPAVFALEKHLEDFLVANWANTELGKKYDIYPEDGKPVGQQYPSDTGPIDILAISKDKKELLVVELKRGRASDTVVGQVQRYMGYVLEELAESGQVVRGLIIALDDDLKIRRALKVTNNIDFMRYKVSFSLFKSQS